MTRYRRSDMDIEIARANMIEQQIRPWNVLELQTLNALREVKREDFVPELHRSLTFCDVQIPLENGETMLEPKLAARMVESLGLDQHHRVLEIGTGTGYVTALLASLCDRVTSIEIHGNLSRQAGLNLGMAGFENIELVESDCFEYCGDESAGVSFDRVIVTGSVPSLAGLFDSMLSSGGYTVGIEGSDPAMQVVRTGPGITTQSLFDTVVARLRNVDEAPSFEF